MKAITQTQLKKSFYKKWLIANFAGWFIGVISTFVLSYFVVNLFYPKETNVILGFCIGAGVGYAQWLVLRRSFGIKARWGHVSSIVLGLPIAIASLLNDHDLSPEMPDSGNQAIGFILFGLICGAIIGFLQKSCLKAHFPKRKYWPIYSALAWGLTFSTLALPMPFSSLAVIVGGLILGPITALAFRRML